MYNIHSIHTLLTSIHNLFLRIKFINFSKLTETYIFMAMTDFLLIKPENFFSHSQLCDADLAMFMSEKKMGVHSSWFFC